MSCWFCQVNLTKGTLKTKRRKIHSDINSKTVSIIESTCWKKLGIDIRATNFIVADYVCHKCVSMVEAVDVSIKEATRKENELTTKLEAAIAAGNTRKRLGCETNVTDDDRDEVSSQPPDKTRRLSDQPRTPSRIATGRLPVPSGVSVSYTDTHNGNYEVSDV